MDNKYETNENSNKASQEEKMDLAKQNALLSEQSNQMLSLVDIINVYDEETENLKRKIEENDKVINNLKIMFNVQILLFLIILVLIWLYVR